LNLDSMKEKMKLFGFSIPSEEELMLPAARE
jgi:hypothetical protein